MQQIRSLSERITEPFNNLADMLRAAATERPDHLAIVLNDTTATYAALDAQIDRIASSLQRDGLAPGDVVAVCASTSIRYVAVYFGCLRAGGVLAPLPPSAKAENLSAMLENSQAKWLFIDSAVHHSWPQSQQIVGVHRIAIDDSDIAVKFSSWLGADVCPRPVEIKPEDPFNLIYSSGTTGVPKGIVQPHGMRWSHAKRAWNGGYRPDSVLITGTPLYSNTTLVALLPALAFGATAVLMDKFDARTYLELAQRYRATHTILVPIQYQRILAVPEFDQYDLSSFQAKFSTSAPFAAQLKADVLARWPGELTEIYGMTEGGGRCELLAHKHPDKLHTVGKPAEGTDIRIIDDQGVEVPIGQSGEIVGRSAAMMHGYHRQPEASRQAEWFSPQGLRFIRTGDVGRFDEDGFLILGDRKKDMLISGGFNIYPSDLESELIQHPDVVDCTVVGVASQRWGETPVGFVVLREGASSSAQEVMDWVNSRLGKTQRLARLEIVADLPRNPIGKVLKRELREAFTAAHGPLV